MDEYKKFVLSQIGIDRYVLRSNSNKNNNLNKVINEDVLIQIPPLKKNINKQSESNQIVENRQKPLNWQTLTSEIKNCQNCILSKERKQVVIGTGDLKPDWLFVGEGPGAEEDQQGLPFVGNSGKLLDNILLSIGLERGKKVYIANAVKCRPPGNRPPILDEIAACQNYLHSQISLLKPKIIVAVGKTATVALLGDDKTPLGKYRQRHLKFQWNNFSNKFLEPNQPTIPIVVTYHPSYLLRNLNDKIKSWEDLVFAMDILNKQNNG